MEARVLFIISKGQNLSVWSGSALDSFGGGCGTLIVTRLLGWLFLDTKQSRHLIKCLTSMTTGQKTATDCVQKAPWNILILFFSTVSKVSAVNRRFKKDPDESVQVKLFTPAWTESHWGVETVFDSYRHCLSMRGRQQKWYLTILLEWQTLGNESSANIFSIHCLPVALVRLSSNALITVTTVKHWFQCSLCLLLCVLHPYQQHVSDTLCFICLDTDVRTPSQHKHIFLFPVCWWNLVCKLWTFLTAKEGIADVYKSFGAILTCLNGCQRFHGRPLGRKHSW